MAYGRSFSVDFPTDSSSFVLNETAARMLQEKFPAQLSSLESAVGTDLRLGSQVGPLVGIVKDFNMATLHEAVEPVIFFFNPSWYNHMLVRVAPGNVAGTVEAVRREWQVLFPDWPFQFSFADQAFDARYRAEEQLGEIFTIFSALAILVACLGLFGLAAYTAQQRTKEIGVRKILGASVGGIILLLSRDFTKLVLIALLAAIPVAYVAMDRWLDTFAYRISIPWWIFLVAGLMALVVAWLSVSYQSIRAGLANPINSLRYE